MIQHFKEIFFGLTNYEFALLGAFLMLFLLRFIFAFFFTGRILFQKKTQNEIGDKNPVSLIMTVRNEEENLKKNLPKILSLENVDFEMVVVDDFSQDNSYQIIGLLKDRYKRLTISTLSQETRFSTKIAKNLAIKATKNNWILSLPVSVAEVNDTWLNEISKGTDENKDVVVAFSTIVGSSGLFNYLFRIENYFLHTKSTASILNGIPFVYNDENVAFRKGKYFELGGYGQKINEPFANLELLINTFIRKKTTSVLFNSKSAIRKTQKTKREDYFDLLKKSIRIEKHLTGLTKFILLIDEISKLLFLPFAILIFLKFFELWTLFVGLLGIQFAANLFIIKTTQNRLNERKIFIPSLVYQFVMPHFKLFFRWHFNNQNKKNRWKNKV